jgi:hypothetical protein
VLKKLQQKTEQQSLVKNLISILLMTSIIVQELRPLQPVFESPVLAVDQFGLLLSKKLQSKGASGVKLLQMVTPKLWSLFVLAQDWCRRIRRQLTTPSLRRLQT